MKIPQSNDSVERGVDFEIRLELRHAAQAHLSRLNVIRRRLHPRTIRCDCLLRNLQIIARYHPRRLCGRREMLISSLIRRQLRLACR